MSIDFFLIWLGVMAPLVFSPGPANIVFALSGAKQGFKKSIPLIAGIDLTFIMLSLLIGFGLGEFLQAYPKLVIIVKLFGIAYLVYLGYKFIKPVEKNAQQNTQSVYTFYDGVLLQLLNPKGWTMLFLMFSLFMHDHFSHIQQVLILVIMLALLNIVAHICWVVAGSAITRYIAHPAIEQKLNIGFSLSLIAVAVWLLIDIVM